MLRLIQHLAEGVRRALDRPERWLIRCVIVAAIIAVVHYSGDKAKDVPTQAILIFLGLAAVAVAMAVTSPEAPLDALADHPADAFAIVASASLALFLLYAAFVELPRTLSLRRS